MDESGARLVGQRAEVVVKPEAIDNTQEEQGERERTIEEVDRRGTG